MNARRQKTWKMLAIGGLFATAGYLAQRLLPSATLAPSTGFLANCNATLWHYQPAMSLDLESLYRDKIFEFILPAEENDAQLKEKLRQVKTRLAKMIDGLRHNELLCNKGCDYINLVLAHPDFYIFIAKDLRIQALGLYRPDMHAVLFDISILGRTDEELEKLVLHEFWHAYKMLVHMRNKNPADPKNPKITPETNLGTAFLRRPAEVAAIRKREFIFALKTGDMRIIRGLPLLLQKEKSASLSPAENAVLIKYKDAIADYTSERFYVVVDPLVWKSIASTVENTLKKGGIYQYTHKVRDISLKLYVNAVKEIEGEIVFDGYSTPLGSEKIVAFIEDTKYRVYVSPLALHLNSYNPLRDKNLWILTERDAYIAGLGEKIKYLFYPELMRFHHCEHNEVLQDFSPTPNKP